MILSGDFKRYVTMHEKLESIKPLLKAGEYEKAAEALKEYRKEFPDDWDGKLMEGVIAKLQGDEETFRRIHDEAQAVIDGHGKDAPQIKASPLWKKYHSTWKKVVTVAIIGVLAAGAVGGAIHISNQISDRIKWVHEMITVGPSRSLYDGPSRPEREIDRPPVPDSWELHDNK